MRFPSSGSEGLQLIDEGLDAGAADGGTSSLQRHLDDPVCGMTGCLHDRGGLLFRSSCVQTTAMAWLPADFIHPTHVPVGDGYHLRPITAADADLDYPAVMGSQPRLWSIFGPAWGWPPASMTYQQDKQDLARHEAEIAAHQSFNYALFDDAETALLGCVYIDPPEKQGADAEISWWVVDDQAGTSL